MARLTIVDRSGISKSIIGDNGLSVMELIRDNGFDELLALCSGGCSCATCRVYVDAAHGDTVRTVRFDLGGAQEMVIIRPSESSSRPFIRADRRF